MVRGERSDSAFASSFRPTDKVSKVSPEIDFNREVLFQKRNWIRKKCPLEKGTKSFVSSYSSKLFPQEIYKAQKYSIGLIQSTKQRLVDKIIWEKERAEKELVSTGSADTVLEASRSGGTVS